MSTIVLVSGGLDSAVLLAQQAQREQVQPAYIRVGLAWEEAELRMLHRLLETSVFARNVAPLETLEFSMRDLYAPTHWAIKGTPPEYDTPDEDVYLAGRNLVLLTKAGVLAASRRAGSIALGPLAGNPFPDATPEFFAAMARALSLGLDHSIAIVTPLIAFEKADVIRLGESLGVPLELTLSCMNPDNRASSQSTGTSSTTKGNAVLPWHCGQCSKCRERRDAFAAAGVGDRTIYSQPSPR